MTTDELPSIFELIGRVMRDVRTIEKTDVNSHFGFRFRGVDTVVDHVGPALRKHGVVIMPELRTHTSELAGKNNRVTVTVAYTFYGPQGDHVTAVVPGEAMDAQDKGSSKAMSVAYRTALVQALSIATGERDPHAGPAPSTKLVRLQAEVKKAMADKGWDWPQLQQDYAEWSQGADLAVADENDLTGYLKVLNPQGTKTMQRRPGASRPAGTN